MLADLRRITEARAPRAEDLVDASVVAGVRGQADAVALPGSPDEVAAVVAWCHERGVPVVPRGGGTGYAGGAVPSGGVVVALERLRRVRSLDALRWRAEVEAGVTTATVARLAREHGLLFPPDPGAAEQSQIGGNVATNAGGPHCFKYGVTGHWVTGLEAVVAPGRVMRVGGPVRKDVAGYDLRSLLVGSEGTLGIITAAWLRFVPRPPVRHALAAGYADARRGGEALERLLGSGVVPAAVEYLDRGALEAARATFPGRPAAGAGFLLLCEVDSSAADRDEALDALGDGAEELDPDVLWRWRDGIGLAVGAVRGGKLSEDVCVPVDRLAEAVEETVAIGARHGLDACSWGHAGDGNLHATFLLDPDDPAQHAAAGRAADDLFAMAVRLGGTVSGEHGLGMLKNGQLRRQWDPAAVGVHEAVKAALDPAGVFNPGKKRP